MMLSDPALTSAQRDKEAQYGGTFTRLLASSFAASYWDESVEMFLNQPSPQRRGIFLLVPGELLSSVNSLFCRNLTGGSEKEA